MKAEIENIMIIPESAGERETLVAQTMISLLNRVIQIMADFSMHRINSVEALDRLDFEQRSTAMVLGYGYKKMK